MTSNKAFSIGIRTPPLVSEHLNNPNFSFRYQSQKNFIVYLMQNYQDHTIHIIDIFTVHGLCMNFKL